MKKVCQKSKKVFQKSIKVFIKLVNPYFQLYRAGLEPTTIGICLENHLKLPQSHSTRIFHQTC